uniref:Mitochondrial inner membrane protease subunit 2 n=1 Tax=Hordeum vulgare subsp. vulgare TaxID=112509 RepID=F2EAL2_HORVV|nr:predicted protein [Hordeum vulgare subsp. vulgare]
MAWAALRPVVKACIGGSLIGITISDRYFSFATVHGGSMRPTFEGSTDGREYALVKRSPLYDYCRGEVVVFVSPVDHRSPAIKRLIGLPGDWISVRDKEEIRKIPEGHCWVEGDNGSASWDSRSYGLVSNTFLLFSLCKSAMNRILLLLFVIGGITSVHDFIQGDAKAVPL